MKLNSQVSNQIFKERKYYVYSAENGTRFGFYFLTEDEADDRFSTFEEARTGERLIKSCETHEEAINRIGEEQDELYA